MRHSLRWDTMGCESDSLRNCYSPPLEMNRARFVNVESGPSKKARFVAPVSSGY